MSDDLDLKNEPNILQCTLKKSWSVFVKLSCGLIIVIAAISAIYIIYGLLLNYGALIFDMILNPSKAMANAIIWGINTIPWPVWALLGIIGAIVGYSYLWCIARVLTDEDLESEEAKVSLEVLRVSALATMIGAMVIDVRMVALENYSVAGVCFVYIILVMIISGCCGVKGYKIPGAYLHYRKRIREVK